MTHILTDIEGTTSSISFVKDVLFPYAAQELPAFLEQQQNVDEIQVIIESIKNECQLQDLQAVIDQCLAWIAADKKQTQLKALQGHIWRHGYESGAYQAHVYQDAFDCLQQWQQAGIPMSVYSSGSILAQHLFFQYSCFGDMRSMFVSHFDTTSGAKQEASSYQNICQALAITAQDIVFLSDVVAELDAAREGGLRTVYLRRDDTMPQSNTHQSVTNFHDINLEG